MSLTKICFGEEDLFEIVYQSKRNVNQMSFRNFRILHLADWQTNLAAHMLPKYFFLDPPVYLTALVYHTGYIDVQRDESHRNWYVYPMRCLVLAFFLLRG